MDDSKKEAKLNVNGKFSLAMNEESRIIEDATKKHGVSDILDDKTVEMIAAIVTNKVGTFKKLENEKLPEASNLSFGKLMSYVLTILTIVVLIMMISSNIGDNSKSGVTSSGKSSSGKEKKVTEKDQESIFPSDKKSIRIGNFEFKRGSAIQDVDYSGKEKIIEDHIKLIISFIKQSEILHKQEMDKMHSYTKQNFLLEGPPGTGKTIFVRYILKKIDVILKKKHIMDKEEGEKIKEELIAAGSDEKKIEEILKKVKSRVIICEVKPSSINDMYVGQSEKNVSILFSAAKTLSKGKNKAVFLFFDEGDVFFEERSSGGSQGNQSAGNVKSELLQKFGVMPDDEYVPLFVYCATNRANVFDDAFKRRFGRQDNFGYPNEKERRTFIEYIFQDYEKLPSNVLDLLVDLTQGKSPSYISSQMKEFYETDDWKITGFRLQEFLEYLDKNKDNLNLG